MGRGGRHPGPEAGWGVKTRKELEAEHWNLRRLTSTERLAVAERDAKFSVGLDRLMELGAHLPLPEPSALPPEYQGARTYVLTKDCFRGVLLPAGSAITVVNEVPSKTWRPATEDELRLLGHSKRKEEYHRARRARGKR